MSSPSTETMPKHGPYPPTTAGLGGSPTKDLDDPITSVFLVLFILGAATHMTIFQLNRRGGRKFVLSGMTFGFCMARIVACTMRLVWSTHPTNLSVAIASEVFVAAGVIILFIINLIFAQRIIRASHPHLGWNRWVSLAFKLLYVSIVLIIIMLITGVVQQFFTLNTNTRRIDHDIVLFGSVFFTVVAFLPIILLAIRAVVPTRGPRDDFGEGGFHAKILIVVLSSIILTLGAAFRCATQFLERPAANPGWFDSKACFYLFDFTIDISVVFFFAIVRVDKRFIVPNGCHAPGDYSRKLESAKLEKDAGNCDGSGEEGVSAPGPSGPGNDLESGLASEKADYDPAVVAPAQPAVENTPAPVAEPEEKPIEDGEVAREKEGVEEAEAPPEPATEATAPIEAPTQAPPAQ